MREIWLLMSGDVECSPYLSACIVTCSVLVSRSHLAMQPCRWYHARKCLHKLLDLFAITRNHLSTNLDILHFLLPSSSPHLHQFKVWVTPMHMSACLPSDDACNRCHSFNSQIACETIPHYSMLHMACISSSTSPPLSLCNRVGELKLELWEAVRLAEVKSMTNVSVMLPTSYGLYLCL